MNRITRVVTVAGLGLAASVLIGAGQASAAPAAGDTGAKHSGSTAVKSHWEDGDIVGYFKNLRKCDKAGDRGEDHGDWDDFDCYKVRKGHHRGKWALKVYVEDDDYDYGDDSDFGDDPDFGDDYDGIHGGIDSGWDGGGDWSFGAYDVDGPFGEFSKS